MTEACVGESDAVLAALDELVHALRQNSARTKRVEQRARRIREQRRKGLPYRDIVSAERGELIVDLTRQNLDALLEAGSRLRRLQARALHDEGLTMQQIAELFGVSRQRVSELLKDAPNGSSKVGAEARPSHGARP